MTLVDLYPCVRLYVEVETIIMTGTAGGGRDEGEMGGGSTRTFWNGTGRGEIRSVRELSLEVRREVNVWGEEMAPPF